MRSFGLAAALVLAAASSPARAAFYVNGSVKGATSSLGYQSIESKGYSGGLSVDLGRYIRIGFTHEQDFQTLEGSEDPISPAVHHDADGNVAPWPVYSNVHTISNSIDLQAVLYEGTVMMPYIIGGIVKKTAYTVGINPTTGNREAAAPLGSLGPQAGVGLGIRLNKDFTLKFQYMVSPGSKQAPGDVKARGVIDRSASIGLTYQI